MTLKIGDVVRLKSGGFPMTVGVTNPPSHAVVCVWHDQDGRMHKEVVDDDLLVSDTITGQEVPVQSALDAALNEYIEKDWRSKRGL